MKRFLNSIVPMCVLIVLAGGCVSYESSLRNRSVGYGYNNTPQQQQPYYTPQSQVPPQSYVPQPNAQPQYGSGQYNNTPQYNSQITFQTFYDELSPFGEWIDTREYGFIWRPYGIDAGWRPYLHNGRWAYTEYAWTWVSDYVWGWAPFHYGRWRLDPFYGWVWHPGNVWGPAWVEWRFWNNNYCWAPLMPGVNIGYGYRGGNYHWSAWNAVPGRYFTQRNIWNHCLPYSQVNTFINNTTIINNTTVINNNTYFTGPAMTDVERYSGKVIPLSLRNLNKVTVSTMDDNSVSMYRPDVTETTGKAQSRAFRPANVTPANQATTGKANVLLNETPENADNLASPKGNPYNPNTQSRDASSPFITPAPSGKSVPNGLGGESGNGGKVAPMPTPIEDERRNTTTPNDIGTPKANPTKQVEQPQPRERNTTKSNPFGSPQAIPPQQEQQREEQRQQEPTRYQKQSQEQQQREEQQRQEQQKQEQQRYQKQAEEQQQRQEQQKQEQQRYQKQAEEQQKRQEQQRQEQQKQEQQRYQKQVEEQQKRQQEQQQRQEQQKQEQQRYQKQAEEQQRHKEEQQKKSNDAEVKKTPAPQQQNYQKKKGGD